MMIRSTRWVPRHAIRFLSATGGTPKRRKERSDKGVPRGPRGSNKPTVGAFGSRGTQGSGKSLIGSASRGTGGLTAEERQRMAAGDEYFADDTLHSGDVLMEVLAEDHRFAKLVEHTTLGDGEAPRDDGDDEEPQLPDGPSGLGMEHRAFLTHAGVGHGTPSERERMAQKQRLSQAEEHVFTYKAPPELKKQREHERKSKAKQRDHDVIENKIQEAMAGGAFDDLPGSGKPLSQEVNVFEAISGEALGNKVLKNAGCVPAWVEQGKHIRTHIAVLRRDLALDWIECGRPGAAARDAAGV